MALRSSRLHEKSQKPRNETPSPSEGDSQGQELQSEYAAEVLQASRPLPLIDLSIYLSVYIYLPIRMHVCTYVCMHICTMYVHIHVCKYNKPYTDVRACIIRLVLPRYLKPNLRISCSHL